MQSLLNEPLTIGDHIKARRIQLRSFQRDVAKQIGVHFASLQNWERNVSVPLPGQIPAVIRFLGYVPFARPDSPGEMLRDLRVCCGWTQNDLAKAAKCAESSIGRWEANNNPDDDKWRSAIIALKRRLNDLGIGELLLERLVALQTHSVPGSPLRPR